MKILLAACLGFGLLAAPAALASGNNPPPGAIDCTESAIKDANARVAGIKDETVRKSVLDDLGNALTLFRSNKKDECLILMERASKAMQGL